MTDPIIPAWTEAPRPYVGLRFQAVPTTASDPAAPAGVCTVTRVARGHVYFRDSLGVLHVVPLDRWHAVAAAE